MKLAAFVRNVNCALFAIAGLATALMPTVLYLKYNSQRGSELTDAVVLLIIAVLGVIVVVSAFWAYRKADNEVPLIFWLVIVGNMAPSIPPTVRQALMACPPPATGCAVMGSAPWWQITVGLVGTTIAAFAIWTECQGVPRSSLELKPNEKRLKLISATLAFIASALFVWTFYDNYTHTFASEIKDAFERGKMVGQGSIPIGGHDYVRPSEATITFAGALVALMAAAGAIQGSYRWLLYAWPFILGLIAFDLAEEAGSTSDWSYRDFTEKYVWFTLFVLGCGGFILAWRSRQHVMRPSGSAH